jgi:hypothetical protein
VIHWSRCERSFRRLLFRNTALLEDAFDLVEIPLPDAIQDEQDRSSDPQANELRLPSAEMLEQSAENDAYAYDSSDQPDFASFSPH